MLMSDTYYYQLFVTFRCPDSFRFCSCFFFNCFTRYWSILVGASGSTWYMGSATLSAVFRNTACIGHQQQAANGRGGEGRLQA